MYTSNCYMNLVLRVCLHQNFRTQITSWLSLISQAISSAIAKVGPLFVNTQISAAALIRERRLLNYGKAGALIWKRHLIE